uniref:Fission, mitochondrial 1 n=1 Tax=Suricata suricatta TaxID=37032 RepID=A0A673VBI4_SURSU
IKLERAAAQREQRGAAGLCVLPGRGELPAQGVEGAEVRAGAAADRAPEQPGQGTGTAYR